MRERYLSEALVSCLMQHNDGIVVRAVGFARRHEFCRSCTKVLVLLSPDVVAQGDSGVIDHQPGIAVPSANSTWFECYSRRKATKDVRLPS